jgi:hypothetical protein
LITLDPSLLAVQMHVRFARGWMPPAKLAISGSPKAGTPVMLAAPSAALDLQAFLEGRPVNVVN